jgi:hypothetical protein
MRRTETTQQAFAKKGISNSAMVENRRIWLEITIRKNEYDLGHSDPFDGFVGGGAFPRTVEWIDATICYFAA